MTTENVKNLNDSVTERDTQLDTGDGLKDMDVLERRVRGILQSGAAFRVR